MAHRTRSKTVDSADTKKSKGVTPRRLTEKIAIIKKREHEQSAEFEQAMQSIFEMQQARIHSGGGSMPSLQAIDSTPPAPSIDMQSIFKDFNEMKRGSGTTYIERPQSAGRRMPIARTSSMETEPYPTVGLGNSDHYWNASAEWIEGDLSRHKSDSDLQQSLLVQQQQQQTSPKHLGSPQQQPRNHKLSPPGDLSIWTSKKRPNSMTTHALLSPDHYVSSPDGLTPPPLGGSVGTASSLPDLTTIEFSSGLDVPLERDDPLHDPQQYNPMVQSQVPSILLSPTSRVAGPSNLIYNSFQAPNNFHTSPHSHNSAFAPNTGFQYPPPASSNPGFRHPSPLTLQAIPPSAGGGISRSPTMPEFRTIHSNGYVPRLNRPLALPQYKPILPNNQVRPFHPLHAGLPNFLPRVGVLQGQTAVTNPTHSPMTIIIQPPPTVANGIHQVQQQQQQPVSTHSTFHQDNEQISHPPPRMPPRSHSFDAPTPNGVSPAAEKSVPNVNSFLNGSPQKGTSVSLSNTMPPSLGHFLPSYAEAKLQQSLQQKFASINVGKNEALIRSHSEENLQKIQKEKPEDIQHNPFMGTLANANSVPCVYVESSNTDANNDRSDSPTTLDSPSTSASYASSPPSVRPYWIEQENSLREYVFNEWPLEGPSTSTGGASGTGRPGSPLAHHRSLTDLSTIPEITEIISNNRAHQLSLPSVAMTDLTVDEQLEKATSPSDFFLPPDADFDMEDAVMESLLKNDVPDLHPFDIPMLTAEANSLVSEVLLSASPDSFLRTHFN